MLHESFSFITIAAFGINIAKGSCKQPSPKPICDSKILGLYLQNPHGTCIAISDCTGVQARLSLCLSICDSNDIAIYDLFTFMHDALYSFIVISIR